MMKRILTVFVFILGLGYVAKACAADPDTISWKEEVVLHDGQKIILDRSFTYGQQGEMGQGRLVSGIAVKFINPENNQEITWETEKKGRFNLLNLLILDVLDGIPYIATMPATCIEFHKWGRPNPPYVFFKYDGQKWKQISVEEFPMELNATNVILNIKDDSRKIMEEINNVGFVSKEEIKKLNKDSVLYAKNIVREKVKFGPTNWESLCPKNIEITE